MLDVISFGDSTLDVFLQLNHEDADVKCNLKDDTCQICLDFADKIPVESVVKVIGSGNASNSAVGSARLGLTSAIVSILGKDDVGTDTMQYWKEQGVSTNFVSIDFKRGTNYSTILNYGGERTILVFHEKRDYVFPANLPPAAWVYYTSMGKGSEKLHRPLLAYLKSSKAKMVFQPGTHQLRLGTEKLRPMIKASEVTIMNKEEAERTVGSGGGKTITHLLKSLHAMGCKIAIVTDGSKGAFSYDGVDTLQMDVMDVPVVERTGAGDSFATGLMAALHKGKSTAEALRWGTANSASVISHIGPQKGLLTTAGMTKFLTKFPNVKAKPY